MKKKAILKKLILTWFIVWACIVNSYSIEAVLSEPVFKNLDLLRRLAIREITWVINSEEPALSREYKVGERVSLSNFILKTQLKAIEYFCNLSVTNSPMHLTLKLHSIGHARVTLSVDDVLFTSFDIDGQTPKGTFIEKYISINPDILGQIRKVEMKVENKGLNGSDPSFTIIGAAVTFPTSDVYRLAMEEWLNSIYTAYSILNPGEISQSSPRSQVHGNAMTHSPIPRKVEKSFEKTVMYIAPINLKLTVQPPLPIVIEESYRKSSALKKFIKGYKFYLVGIPAFDFRDNPETPLTFPEIRNTFQMILDQMSVHGDIVCTHDDASIYEAIERQDPDLFKQIQQKIKYGKWEIIGGAWAKSFFLGNSSISNEAIIRQLLYGKRYFFEKFSIDIDTAWIPDSISLNKNLPQLLVKSGIKRLVTWKSKAENTNFFPYYIYVWKGADSSQLLTYVLPFGSQSGLKMPEDMRDIRRYEIASGYKKALIHYPLGEDFNPVLPDTPSRIVRYRNYTISPQYIYSRSSDFFFNLEKDLKKKIPVWTDESKPDTLAPTPSSDKGNPNLYSHLLSTERLASIAFILGNPYPQESLQNAWKATFTSQDKTPEVLSQIRYNSLETISNAIDTRSISGTPLIVLNMSSQSCSGPVVTSISLPTEQGIVLKGPDGNPVQVRIDRNPETSTAMITFNATDIPPFSYHVYSYTTDLIKEKTLTNEVTDSTLPGNSLLSIISSIHQGSLPAREGKFIEVKASHVILDAVKKAEADNAIVFRFRETTGESEECEISFFKPPKNVIDTNLMEKPHSIVPFAGASMKIQLNPFEIKTVKVYFE